MFKDLSSNEIFGFIKPYIDVHTLGIATIASLLHDCGYKAIIAENYVSKALAFVQNANNWNIVKNWIKDNNITRIGFSFRLDPYEARTFFMKLYVKLQENNMFIENGGPIKGIFFAGLPKSCELIEIELGNKVLYFPGDEEPKESLSKLGVPSIKFPKNLINGNRYDEMRWNFAKELIESEEYKLSTPPYHSGYPRYGSEKDSITDRIEYNKIKNKLPIIRAHVGPYNTNREEAVKEFISWCKQLSKSGFLDVLSIGTSQLTQSNFGGNWEGLPNGGGVPVNSVLEYAQIYEAAKPMLVRTYAGTKDIPYLAQIHEKYLNISWHALSFWWFCEIDGRGNNSVFENLKEHFETIKYIASTGKPLEANIPHHFSFRGGDDITYIISVYLAAKAAKLNGIKTFILQNMLNTPKYTWGIQDLAKGQAMLKLVRELEDNNFKVYLQSRAGLDYFSPDENKAKIQLACVTALMDDLEPLNNNSPEIIHVVSYSEAIKLATPSIIDESIKITLSSLAKYRYLREQGKIENMAYNKELLEKTEQLFIESKEAIAFLETHIYNLYTPKGLTEIFENGYLPVPYLIDSENKYPKAKMFKTSIIDGGVKVIDESGNIINTTDRYIKIYNSNQ